MTGLSGPRAAATVKELSAFYGVGNAAIYTAAKSVRPERKKRSDCGRRKADLLKNEALRFAAELVSNQSLSPELALLTMQENKDRFGSVEKIHLGTFRRYLREHGVSRVQARKNRMTYRSFEADFPGQIYQFDISGVKQRWVDVKTRTIHKVVTSLEVSKNHPNRRQNRIPLWKFTLKDDKSRKTFVRFVACPKANTVHVVDFLKEAFIRLGLPFKLYTDNDSIIDNKRMRRGAQFINEAFRELGGFEMIQHLPGRPQATGKVERAHQVVEEFEKLIGVSTTYGSRPTVDALNRFADWLCYSYNNSVCRTTGIAPNIAFRATTNPLRLIDANQFDAAFKARDLECKVRPDITIAVDGTRYQLSRRDEDPFRELAVTGQKVQVYWIDDADFFACVTPAGDEYTVQKIVAQADAAFEFKALPESRGEQTKKALKASQKERIQQLKSEAAESTPAIIVPGIDTAIPEAEPTNLIGFPQRIETGDTERLHELTYQLANDDAPAYSRKLDLFAALDLLQSEGKAPCEPCPELTETKSWLRQIFDGDELITEADLNAAWNADLSPQRRRLAAIR